jgi:hypothetical protein
MLDKIDQEFLDKTPEEIQNEIDINTEFQNKRESSTSDELLQPGTFMLDDELEVGNRDHLLNFGDNTQEQGWKKISGVMDSGAADHVGNRKMLPELPILPSPGSIRGQAFISATGGRAENEGEQHLNVFTEGGASQT